MPGTRYWDTCRGFPDNVREADWKANLNKKSHSWAVTFLTQYLVFEDEERGVEVLKENEWNTSKMCSRCGYDFEPG